MIDQVVNLINIRLYSILIPFFANLRDITCTWEIVRNLYNAISTVYGYEMRMIHAKHENLPYRNIQ